MTGYEFLTDKQNDALKKYFGGEEMNSTERYHMTKIRERCKEILTHKQQAEDLLIKLS